MNVLSLEGGQINVSEVLRPGLDQEVRWILIEWAFKAIQGLAEQKGSAGSEVFLGLPGQHTLISRTAPEESRTKSIVDGEGGKSDTGSQEVDAAMG